MKLLLSVVVVLTAVLCSAEEQATLALRLHDASGAPIANARVSLVSNTKGRAQRNIAVQPDSTRGQYSAAVTPGIYDVFISAPCFAPIALQLKLSTGDHKALSERMKFQDEVQKDYRSDGCPPPFIVPRTPLVDSTPPPLPERIQPGPSEPERAK